MLKRTYHAWLRWRHDRRMARLFPDGVTRTAIQPYTGEIRRYSQIVGGYPKRIEISRAMGQEILVFSSGEKLTENITARVREFFGVPASVEVVFKTHTAAPIKIIYPWL